MNSPSEVLKPGQETDVYILSLDREEKKIALSVRRAYPDPWEKIDERYGPDQVVEGTVTKLAPFGVFVRIEEGVEGLAHASDLGEEVLSQMREEETRQFRILSVESARRRIRLVPADMEIEPESLVMLDTADAGEGRVVGTSDSADTETEGAEAGEETQPDEG